MTQIAGTPRGTSASPGTPGSSDRARARAAREWAELRGRLARITPRDLARTGLVLAVAGGATWLTLASWPALLPFVVGGLIAYTLLPAVDALNRVLPRGVAAFASVAAVVAALIAIVVLVLPPLTLALVRTAVDLPDATEIDAAIDRLQASLGAPEDSSRLVAPLLAGLATAVKDGLASVSGGLDDVVREVAAGLLRALGALIGLIVLPTWMLTVMRDKERARTALDRHLAPWLRRDAWSAIAIVDRATGAYLRGYVTVAALVGAFTWLGLRASPRLGGPEFQEPLALAVMAGTAQMVPAVGGFLGLLPALLILPLAADRAAAYAVAYFAARFVGSTLLGARVRERRLGVHPAIMVPGIVAIGQFGLLWLLLSAPIVAIVHDLARYVHGRLSEPARPAGWLPGVAPRQPVPVAAATLPAVRDVPPPAPLPRAAPGGRFRAPSAPR